MLHPSGTGFAMTASPWTLASENGAGTTYDLKHAVADNRLVGLWRLMTDYRLKYLGATLAVALAAVFRTASFFLVRYLVDDVLGQDEASRQLALVAVGLIFLASIQGGFSFISGTLAAQTAEGVARRLRNYLYDHIQRLSFTYHDHTPTGELIQRCTSDVDALRRFYADQAVQVGRILSLFIVNFVALLLLNWRLALFSTAVVPVLVLMSGFFFRKVSKAYEAFQEQDAVVSTTLQENLSGVRVVKAFARQDYERDKFEQENWKKYRLGRRLLLMHSAYWPTSDILAAMQMLAGFTVGALMAINGTITLGTYLAYSSMLILLIWPVRNLGRLIVQASSGLVSYERVVKVIKEDREPLTTGSHRPAEEPQGGLVFRGVSFQYEEDAPVLEQITFQCKPGQVIALLGSTGSGKTSLINLLPRFYEYTSGRLLLDGVDLKEYPRKFLRQYIGVVEQEPFLFSRTIRDNIAYGVGRDVADQEIEAAARAAAIHDVILTFPEGYKTLVGEKGVTLSGGQKQRVAIARALLKDPRILILDDATSSVDTETEAQIRGALQHLMKGRTTFVIAHRVQSVMGADLILVMDQGRIVQHGTHDYLVAQPGIYRKIYEMQTRIEEELERELADVGLL
jgi:ATP-binding cassette subfamily B protein